MGFKEMSELVGRLHKIYKRFNVAIKIGGDLTEVCGMTESDIDDIQSYMSVAGYNPYGKRQYGKNGVTITFRRKER